jgi:probable phosphoglycerate mutase
MLMRHGQTHANVSGALDTAHPGLELTPLGQRQAVAAARALSEDLIEGIYVSSRVRTHQTAEPTAADRRHTPSMMEGLEEVNAGEFEMRTDSDAIHGYIGSISAWLTGDLRHRMPGGETGLEFLERYDAAVANICDAGHESALIVSHGAAIRTWTAARMLAGTEVPDPTSPLHNTALIVLEGDPLSGWRMVSWTGDAVGGAYLDDTHAVDPTAVADPAEAAE